MDTTEESCFDFQRRQGFSLLQNIYTASGVYPVTHLVVVPEVKRAGRKADYSLPSNAEFKKEYSSTSTFPRPFMARRDSIVFLPCLLPLAYYLYSPVQFLRNFPFPLHYNLQWIYCLANLILLFVCDYKYASFDILWLHKMFIRDTWYVIFSYIWTLIFTQPLFNTTCSLHSPVFFKVLVTWVWDVPSPNTGSVFLLEIFFQSFLIF
jgi:hypothetical protein